MALIICSECGKEFSDKAPACPHCGCPIEFAKPQPISNEKTHQSTSTTENSQPHLLRDYLENVRALETDIYTIGKIIDKLLVMDKTYPEKRTFSPPEAPAYPKPVYMVYEPTAAQTIKRELYFSLKHPIYSLTSPIRAAQEVKKLNNGESEQQLINKRRREIEAERQKEYEDQLKEYRRLLNVHEATVAEEEKRHERACLEVDIYNQGIKNQIAYFTKERENTKKALQALYKTDIIFPKYWGIVPVTMFCEYMDSGRRTELGGVHGMYDLYESELIGKRIVDSISQVNESLKYISYQINGIANQLSGIARNQVMLHEEIARGNAISEKISSDTRTVLENSASLLAATGKINDELQSIHRTAQITEANTAATAYNAEVTARRVNAIAKIEEYEYSLRHPAFPSV